MIGFPVTLPIESGKARRWYIVDGIDSDPADESGVISLVITVTPAEAANCLRHLAPQLGKPAIADFPGIDEIAEASDA